MEFHRKGNQGCQWHSSYQSFNGGRVNLRTSSQLPTLPTCLWLRQPQSPTVQRWNKEEKLKLFLELNLVLLVEPFQSKRFLGIPGIQKREERRQSLLQTNPHMFSTFLFSTLSIPSSPSSPLQVLQNHVNRPWLRIRRWKIHTKHINLSWYKISLQKNISELIKWKKRPEQHSHGRKHKHLRPISGNR